MVAFSLQPTKGDLVLMVQCSEDSTHLFRVEFKYTKMTDYEKNNDETFLKINR